MIWAVTEIWKLIVYKAGSSGRYFYLVISIFFCFMDLHGLNVVKKNKNIDWMNVEMKTNQTGETSKISPSLVRILKTSHRGTITSKWEAILNFIQLQFLVEVDVLKLANILMQNGYKRWMQNLLSKNFFNQMWYNRQKATFENIFTWSFFNFLIHWIT